MRELYSAGGTARAVAAVFLAIAVAAPGTASAFSPGTCISPPALVTPLEFRGKCPEDQGGPLNVDAKNRDVMIALPTDKACGARLSVVNARNIRIVGGKFVYTGADGQVISVGRTSGTTFIDGVHIDVNAKRADAIRFYRHTGTAVIQNTLIEGVSGLSTGVHGDIVHPQGDGPLTKLTLQNVTGYSGYQGLFTPYRVDSGHGTHELELDRVNFGYDPEVIVTKPLMLLFIGDINSSLDQPPDRGTKLSNVFVDGSVRSFAFDRAIYARPIKDGVGCATFASGHKVNGMVCGGKPISGDFVPANLVGLGYDRTAFCPSQTIAATTTSTTR